MKNNVTTGKITNEKYEIEYFTFGEGERPFVIIPGLAMRSVISMAPSVAAAYSGFAQDYKVYLIERRSTLDYGYTVADMAEDTAEAMKELGITGACIFGASQGGMIAQYIAARHPELVSKLALGSTAARLNDTGRANIEEWAALAKAENVVELNRSMFSKIYSAEYYDKFRSAFELLEKQGTPEELKRVAVLAEGCLTLNAYDELDGIKCPTLVIGAENDNVLTVDASSEIAEKLGCELYVYEGGSHAAYDEAEDYKERLLRFFA